MDVLQLSTLKSESIVGMLHVLENQENTSNAHNRTTDSPPFSAHSRAMTRCAQEVGRRGARESWFFRCLSCFCGVGLDEGSLSGFEEA